MSVVSVVSVVAGCRSNLRILNPGVERAPIVFESPAAAETFERELEDRYDDGDADVPALGGRLSLAAFFNQEIKVADRDNDGIITEAEAERYAE